MKLKNQEGGWNPYIAGVLAGILAVLSVVISTQTLGKPKYLGTSTTFVRAAGLVERFVAPTRVENNEYFTSKKVKVDWQMMLVAGILIGACVSALQDKSFTFEKIPPMWQEQIGASPTKRGAAAFIGGLIAILGVRLAGGCPSGHGLSGIMQLSVSGLIAIICFMVGGIVTAQLIYRKGV